MISKVKKLKKKRWKIKSKYIVEYSVVNGKSVKIYTFFFLFINF